MRKWDCENYDACLTAHALPNLLFSCAECKTYRQMKTYTLSRGEIDGVHRFLIALFGGKEGKGVSSKEAGISMGCDGGDGWEQQEMRIADLL